MRNLKNHGTIFVVGCGALTKGSLTFDAHSVLSQSDHIVGYKAYVEAIRYLFPKAEFISTAMKQEVDRVRKAVRLAQKGARVSVVCSGDSGIYAMAGLVFEVIERKKIKPVVKVIPGIPALAVCASALGAPLMNDFGVISFSNLLTPGAEIEKRLKAFLASGAVIVIYNPVSKGRRALFERLWKLIRSKRGKLWGGYVKNGGRENEESGIYRVKEMPLALFDMHTLIIIGNEHTACINDRLVTRRGYSIEEKTKRDAGR